MLAVVVPWWAVGEIYRFAHGSSLYRSSANFGWAIGDRGACIALASRILGKKDKQEQQLTSLEVEEERMEEAEEKTMERSASRSPSRWWTGSLRQGTSRIMCAHLSLVRIWS